MSRWLSEVYILSFDLHRQAKDDHESLEGHNIYINYHCTILKLIIIINSNF